MNSLLVMLLSDTGEHLKHEAAFIFSAAVQSQRDPTGIYLLAFNIYVSEGWEK